MLSTRHEAFDHSSEPELWKGVVAGTVAGAAATVAINAFEIAWQAVDDRLSNGNEDEDDGDAERFMAQRREASRLQLRDRPGAQRYRSPDLTAERPTRQLQSGADTGGELGSGPDRTSDGGSGEDEQPTEKAADAIAEEVFDYELSRTQKMVAGQTIHFGFGIAMGALYGLAAEVCPQVTAGQGLPWGAALMVGAQEVGLPAVGLTHPPHKIPLEKHAEGLAAHLVYGLTCELVRRSVRRALD